MLTIYSAFWLRAGSQVSDSETLKFQSCSAAIKSSGTLVRGHLMEDLIVAQQQIWHELSGRKRFLR
jgi:hypothetical protein